MFQLDEELLAGNSAVNYEKFETWTRGSGWKLGNAEPPLEFYWFLLYVSLQKNNMVCEKNFPVSNPRSLTFPSVEIFTCQIQWIKWILKFLSFSRFFLASKYPQVGFGSNMGTPAIGSCSLGQHVDSPLVDWIFGLELLGTKMGNQKLGSVEPIFVIQTKLVKFNYSLLMSFVFQRLSILRRSY